MADGATGLTSGRVPPALCDIERLPELHRPTADGSSPAGGASSPRRGSPSVTVLATNWGGVSPALTAEEESGLRLDSISSQQKWKWRRESCASPWLKWTGVRSGDDSLRDSNVSLNGFKKIIPIFGLESVVTQSFSKHDLHIAALKNDILLISESEDISFTLCSKCLTSSPRVCPLPPPPHPAAPVYKRHGVHFQLCSAPNKRLQMSHCRGGKSACGFRKTQLRFQQLQIC